MALLYNLIPALATHPTFRPPTLTRAELRDKSHLESLQSALTSNGIVAISQIDNYSSLRVAALRAANACHKPALHTFADGTTRATSAATPNTAVEGCDATDPSLTQFRALVAQEVSGDGGHLLCVTLRKGLMNVLGDLGILSLMDDWGLLLCKQRVQSRGRGLERLETT